MTLQEAKNILGDRATWELKNMRKALSMLSALNTTEEDRRLEAVNTLLKNRK